jgi:hypothetical protein
MDDGVFGRDVKVFRGRCLSFPRGVPRRPSFDCALKSITVQLCSKRSPHKSPSTGPGYEASLRIFVRREQAGTAIVYLPHGVASYREHKYWVGMCGISHQSQVQCDVFWNNVVWFSTKSTLKLKRY